MKSLAQTDTAVKEAAATITGSAILESIIMTAGGFEGMCPICEERIRGHRLFFVFNEIGRCMRNDEAFLDVIAADIPQQAAPANSGVGSKCRHCGNVTLTVGGYCVHCGGWKG